MNFIKTNLGGRHKMRYLDKNLFVKKSFHFQVLLQQRDNNMRWMNRQQTAVLSWTETSKKHPSRVPLWSVLHWAGICAATTRSFINRDMSLSLQLFGHFFIQNEGRWQCLPSQQLLQPLAEGGGWRLNYSTVFTKSQLGTWITEIESNVFIVQKWFCMQVDKPGGTSNSRFAV